MRLSRRAQLTLFDVFLNVIQPAALVLIGAAVVNLDDWLYVTLLALAVVMLIFVQYSASLRNQSDRARDLFSDYLQDRSNLLSVLTGIASYSPDSGNLTKSRLLGGVEIWFEEEILHDYHWDQEIAFRERQGIRFRQKPIWKRWSRNPGRELTYAWYRLKSRLRNQPSVELIDIVFYTPNEDIASLVIARALEEGFIDELLIAGDAPSDARIEFVWTDSVIVSQEILK